MPKSALNHVRYYDTSRVRRDAALKRRAIMRLRASGKTLHEIAIIYGISRQRVSQIEKRARKLAEELK